MIVKDYIVTLQKRIEDNINKGIDVDFWKKVKDILESKNELHIEKLLQIFDKKNEKGSDANLWKLLAEDIQKEIDLDSANEIALIDDNYEAEDLLNLIKSLPNDPAFHEFFDKKVKEEFSDDDIKKLAVNKDTVNLKLFMSSGKKIEDLLKDNKDITKIDLTGYFGPLDVLKEIKISIVNFSSEYFNQLTEDELKEFQKNSKKYMHSLSDEQKEQFCKEIVSNGSFSKYLDTFERKDIRSNEDYLLKKVEQFVDAEQVSKALFKRETIVFFEKFVNDKNMDAKLKELFRGFLLYMLEYKNIKGDNLKKGMGEKEWETFFKSNLNDQKLCQQLDEIFKNKDLSLKSKLEKIASLEAYKESAFVKKFNEFKQKFSYVNVIRTIRKGKSVISLENFKNWEVNAIIKGSLNIEKIKNADNLKVLFKNLANRNAWVENYTLVVFPNFRKDIQKIIDLLNDSKKSTKDTFLEIAKSFPIQSINDDQKKILKNMYSILTIAENHFPEVKVVRLSSEIAAINNETPLRKLQYLRKDIEKITDTKEKKKLLGSFLEKIEALESKATLFSSLKNNPSKLEFYIERDKKTGKFLLNIPSKELVDLFQLLLNNDKGSSPILVSANPRIYEVDAEQTDKIEFSLKGLAPLFTILDKAGTGHSQEKVYKDSLKRKEYGVANELHSIAYYHQETSERKNLHIIHPDAIGIFSEEAQKNGAVINFTGTGSVEFDNKAPKKTLGL